MSPFLDPSLKYSCNLSQQHFVFSLSHQIGQIINLVWSDWQLGFMTGSLSVGHCRGELWTRGAFRETCFEKWVKSRVSHLETRPSSSSYSSSFLDLETAYLPQFYLSPIEVTSCPRIIKSTYLMYAETAHEECGPLRSTYMIKFTEISSH